MVGKEIFREMTGGQRDDYTESQRAKKKLYYHLNRDKILKQKKDYHQKNKEKILKEKREYHWTNRDTILKKKKQRSYPFRKSNISKRNVKTLRQWHKWNERIDEAINVVKILRHYWAFNKMNIRPNYKQAKLDYYGFRQHLKVA